MDDYVVFSRSEIRPDRPVMVVGLPDSGYVGKIAVDHLIEELKPALVAEIYSPYLPPQLLIRDSGVSELVAHHLYYSGDRNLLVYTGDSQPVDGEGAYRLSQFIVGLTTRYNVQATIVLAAMIRDITVEEPQVFVSGTSSKLVDDYVALGAKRTSMGSITWMHGLILGEAGRAGVGAVCLSSETRGNLPDAKAAEAALRLLGKKLRFEVNTTKLREKGKEIALQIASQSGEAKEIRKDKTPYIS